MECKYLGTANKSSQICWISSEHIPVALRKDVTSSENTAHEIEDIRPTALEEVKKEIQYNINSKKASPVFGLITGEVLIPKGRVVKLSNLINAVFGL